MKKITFSCLLILFFSITNLFSQNTIANLGTLNGSNYREAWNSYNVGGGCLSGTTVLVVGYSSGTLNDYYGGADWAFKLPNDFTNKIQIKAITVVVNGLHCDAAVSNRAKLTFRAEDGSWLDTKINESLNLSYSKNTFQINSNYIEDCVKTYNGALYLMPIISSEDNYNIENIQISIEYIKPPSKALYSSPLNNKIDVPLDAKLKWSNGGGATSYKVYFGTSNPPTYVEDLTSLSDVYTPSLNQTQKYYWRIDARNSAGTATGDTWNFTTGKKIVSYELTLYPSAIQIDGRWKVDSGLWKKTEEQEHITADTDHTISFLDVSGWTSPSSYKVNIPSSNFLVTTSARYLEGVAPKAPTTPNPNNSTTNISIDTEFSWVNGGYATSYRIQIYNGTEILVDNIQTNTTFKPNISLNYNTTYNWRVIAINNIDGIASDLWSFSTEEEPLSLPSKPLISFPTNGATDVATNSQLTWTNGGGASTYNVFFGTSEASMLGVSSSQTGLNFSPTMNNGKGYFWRIDAINSSGTTIGDLWQFSTVSSCFTPDTPSSASGTATGQTTADLSWTAGNSDVTYYWVIGSNSSVTYGNGIKEGHTTGTSVSVTGLTAGTQYYLRVYAQSSCDNSTSGYKTSAPFTTTSATIDFTNAFITTWETTTTNESITIPTSGSGYNYAVDWGDGNISTAQTGNATHTYATKGTHTVKIKDAFLGIYFYGASDKLKIKTIEQWGANVWVFTQRSFFGCSNLTSNATDSPDLRNVTNISYMFYGASSFNGNLSNWDVSGVTRMSGMFYGASSFNQDLGSWDISSVTDMSDMFKGATLSEFNYDNTLNGWSTLSTGETKIPRGIIFNGGSSMYTNAGKTRRDLLTGTYSWTITDGGLYTQEKAALIALYNATDGPNWTNNFNWNTTQPLSNWNGVQVDDNGHVIGITLINNNLEGTLPSEIGDLPYLKSLDLHSNSGITGVIPPEIGQLTNLEILNLWHDLLSGNVPTSITTLTKLSFLNLNGNHFSGALPDLTQLPLLNGLHIMNNDFEFGDFENEFASYKNNIPNFYDSPMNKKDLEISNDLVVGDNYTMTMSSVSGTGVTYQWYKNDEPISGAISLTYTINNLQPSDAGNYTCKASSPIVTDLLIERETIHLYGILSQEDRNVLIALYDATNGDNWTNNTNWKTSAPIYEWYGVSVQGTRVSKIELDSNNLVGYIPAEVGNLTELITFSLEFNQLSGTIPVEIGNLTNLKYLTFWTNNLSGTIPKEIGNLTKLELISLEANQLTGSIPSEFANLTALKDFWVNENLLTGDVPDIFETMPDLINFSIYDNNLIGEVHLANLNKLLRIWTMNNQLSKLDVSNDVNLMWLKCNTNQLTSLNISNNTELTQLNVSNNQIANGLDVSKNIKLSSFDATGNTNLICIQVNQEQLSAIPSYWSKDVTAGYNLDCSSYLDDDGDGVMNDVDQCPNTPSGETVDANGCSSSQLDDDGDGVMNNVDQCPNTALGINVDDVGCPIFTLPSNNFNIAVTSETCPDKNNGQLIITATENYNYVATINGTDYTFTNSTTITGLPPGSYSLKITITGETFEQWFTVEVLEGTTVSGKSEVKSNKATVNIENGTAPYKIYVNGKEQFETLSKEFSVEVRHGDYIEVKTAKSCEGVYSKAIALLEGFIVYPNPTTGLFEIAIPTNNQEVTIGLYTATSQLVFEKTYPVNYGKVQLSLKNQPSGMYLAKIQLDVPVNLTIIKE